MPSASSLSGGRGSSRSPIEMCSARRSSCTRLRGCPTWRSPSGLIFPTDPDFAVKAGRILDLYAGRWDGDLLHPGDMVISADEKPSIQARQRIRDVGARRRCRARQSVEHT